MKQVSDYIFYDYSWLRKLNLERGASYFVLEDLGDLRKGRQVKFAGFDDVDNHYGILVFVDLEGTTLEVTGDFSSPEGYRFEELKRALKKA